MSNIKLHLNTSWKYLSSLYKAFNTDKQKEPMATENTIMRN